MTIQEKDGDLYIKVDVNSEAIDPENDQIAQFLNQCTKLAEGVHSIQYNDYNID